MSRKVTCLLMHPTHDKISEKNGLKVWNGDKLMGEGSEESDGFLFTGKEAGIREDIPKTVFIPAFDVSMCTYADDEETWVPVTPKIRFCPWCGHRSINLDRHAYVEVGDYDEAKECYEQEYNVVEHICSHCDRVFFA